LVTFAEGLARGKGAGDITLLTDRENKAAYEFYKAMGYEKRAVTMGKTLSSK
jgi:ribosomal protein S18 acetylase RimI-like enzyme